MPLPPKRTPRILSQPRSRPGRLAGSSGPPGAGLPIRRRRPARTRVLVQVYAARRGGSGLTSRRPMWNFPRTIRTPSARPGYVRDNGKS